VNTAPDLELRQLRSFVAVAEELHFTRAAARLFVAQQALSRDIRRLEADLGVALFVRTTRRVTLTAEGERFLERARELVALHDRAVRELREPARPIVVDALSEGRLTGARILELARATEPAIEFRGRYGGGVGTALAGLLAGDVDFALGRAHWLEQEPAGGLVRRLVRLEPLAVLLPRTHPLASRPAVQVTSLEGSEIDANPASDRAPEWSDLVRQFLALSRAHPTPPHVPALGPDDQAHHLIRQGLPILTAIDHLDIAGGVIRPLVDPVPLYPWSIVHRRGATGAGLDAVLRSAAWLAHEEGWLERPTGSWLPQPEAALFERGELVFIERTTAEERRENRGSGGVTEPT
jgi:DNA-binding transcriptional LysR family regulator